MLCAAREDEEEKVLRLKRAEDSVFCEGRSGDFVLRSSVKVLVKPISQLIIHPCARRCSTVFPDRSNETSAFERDDGLAILIGVHLA